MVAPSCALIEKTCLALKPEATVKLNVLETVPAGTLIVAGTVIAGSLVVRLIVVAVDEGMSSKTIPVPLGPGIGSSTIANWNEGATTDYSTLYVDLPAV